MHVIRIGVDLQDSLFVFCVCVCVLFSVCIKVFQSVYIVNSLVFRYTHDCRRNISCFLFFCSDARLVSFPDLFRKRSGNETNR